MAHTRGTSKRFVPDDGVILGKGGVPLSPDGQPIAGPLAYEGKVPLDRQGHFISPSAARLAAPVGLDGDQVIRGPGVQPQPAQAAITGYRSDRKTWSRGMDAWTLAGLLDLALRKPGDLTEGFVVNLTVEEYTKLPGDLRVQFMPVRGGE